MLMKSLKQFLIDANKAGYASGENKNWKKEEDKSTTIIFESGDWKMHDNYFGGEPYGGREVIFYKNEPYMIMVYYGFVKKGVNAGEIYPFLQKALSLMPEDNPYRGPSLFEENELIYKNEWVGELERFSGEEIIYRKDEEVYRAKYIGGVVDQK
jgi:hypothetical protein